MLFVALLAPNNLRIIILPFDDSNACMHFTLMVSLFCIQLGLKAIKFGIRER